MFSYGLVHRLFRPAALAFAQQQLRADEGLCGRLYCIHFALAFLDAADRLEGLLWPELPGFPDADMRVLICNRSHHHLQDRSYLRNATASRCAGTTRASSMLGIFHFSSLADKVFACAPALLFS